MKTPNFDQSPRYCYICSSGRSGSTLLNMLIGGHSQVAPLGEFNFFGKAIALNQICSCGETMQSCSSWNRVIERIKTERDIDLRSDPYALRQWDTHASHQIDHDDQTQSYLAARRLRSYYNDFRNYLPSGLAAILPLPPMLREGVRNTFYLYETIMREWNCGLVADQSKNIHHAINLYRTAPGKVRIVYLVRNGRGVFLSKRGANTRAASLSGWAKYNSRAAYFLPRAISKDHYIRIHYEDLVTRQEETLGNICKLLGIEYEDSMRDLGANVRHLVNGNPTMYRKDQRVVLDERWKTQLQGEDKRFFDKYGAALNRRLGYQ